MINKDEVNIGDVLYQKNLPLFITLDNSIGLYNRSDSVKGCWLGDSIHFRKSEYKYFQIPDLKDDDLQCNLGKIELLNILYGLHID